MVMPSFNPTSPIHETYWITISPLHTALSGPPLSFTYDSYWTTISPLHTTLSGPPFSFTYDSYWTTVRTAIFPTFTTLTGPPSFLYIWYLLDFSLLPPLKHDHCWFTKLLIQNIIKIIYYIINMISVFFVRMFSCVENERSVLYKFKAI